MSEKELSIDQKRRIEKIKNEWFAELEKLPKLNLGKNRLSNYSNHPRRELEKKYLPMIQAIYDE